MSSRRVQRKLSANNVGDGDSRAESGRDRMREIGTSGSMSGETKWSDAPRAKLLRLPYTTRGPFAISRPVFHSGFEVSLTSVWPSRHVVLVRSSPIDSAASIPRPLRP